MVWPDQGLNSSLPDHWQTLYPLGKWAGLVIIVNSDNWRFSSQEKIKTMGLFSYYDSFLRKSLISRKEAFPNLVLQISCNLAFWMRILPFTPQWLGEGCFLWSGTRPEPISCTRFQHFFVFKKKKVSFGLPSGH